MIKNDKYALLIAGVGAVAFFIGMATTNLWLTVPGFTALLIGASAYRGAK